MILVIGGRSKIGSVLIDDLLARGEQVRALTRLGEAGRFPDGVEPVAGDLADICSLAAAMSGADKVFLLCGPVENEYELNRNAIDVAQGADVRLLVRSSILGADPEAQATFARDHGACDEYLRDSELDFTIVRPNLFLQNVPETTIPAIDTDGRFYVNAGDARISMVDTRDVAAVAAVALTEPGHESQEYEVTGPEPLSYADVAAELSEVQGRTITYVDVDDDATRKVLLGYGGGEWLAGALVDLYQDYRRSGRDGYACEVSDTVDRLTGRPARSLRALLLEQLAVPS
ncbi:MAG: SDR family oxidoreductase [Solirubrobacterales bacterium]|nr:SDR family oxidoreductase [Solirubrobacterales bacterium]MBV9364483.1 SDR family oxidoreductase [Solirubrobacterales bacterium]MBV9810295.1 SDR family oxidoreductase [Solirubrobacterales bacterium]